MIPESPPEASSGPVAGRPRSPAAVREAHSPRRRANGRRRGPGLGHRPVPRLTPIPDSPRGLVTGSPGTDRPGPAAGHQTATPAAVRRGSRREACGPRRPEGLRKGPAGGGCLCSSPAAIRVAAAPGAGREEPVGPPSADHDASPLVCRRQGRCSGSTGHLGQVVGRKVRHREKASQHAGYAARMTAARQGRKKSAGHASAAVPRARAGLAFPGLQHGRARYKDRGSRPDRARGGFTRRRPIASWPGPQGLRLAAPAELPLSSLQAAPVRPAPPVTADPGPGTPQLHQAFGAVPGPLQLEQQNRWTRRPGTRSGRALIRPERAKRTEPVRAAQSREGPENTRRPTGPSHGGRGPAHGSVRRPGGPVAASGSRHKARPGGRARTGAGNGGSTRTDVERRFSAGAGRTGDGEAAATPKRSHSGRCLCFPQWGPSTGHRGRAAPFKPGRPRQLRTLPPPGLDRTGPPGVVSGTGGQAGVQRAGQPLTGRAGGWRGAADEVPLQDRNTIQPGTTIWTGTRPR